MLTKTEGKEAKLDLELESIREAAVLSVRHQSMIYIYTFLSSILMTFPGLQISDYSD